MIDLAQIFIEPLSFTIMQRALIASLITGLACAVFSCFLIVKGWSLMGDAISHSVLPGIAAAYILGIPLIFGALIAGTACAFGVGYIKNNSRIKEDAAMGIVFSGLFALGLVMVTKIESDIHLTHILFGNILGASWDNIRDIGLITGPLLILAASKWKDLMLYCFDKNYGQSIGLNITYLHYGMLICLSLTIVSAIQMVGVILVVAMLITPGAAAFLLTKSFAKMILISLGLTIISCFIGVTTSYHANLSPAPIIVLLQSGFFAIALTCHLLRRPATIIPPSGS